MFSMAEEAVYYVMYKYTPLSNIKQIIEYNNIFISHIVSLKRSSLKHLDSFAVMLY